MGCERSIHISEQVIMYSGFGDGLLSLYSWTLRARGHGLLVFFPSQHDKTISVALPWSQTKHNTEPLRAEVARVLHRLIQSLILHTAASEQWGVRCYTTNRRSASDATDLGGTNKLSRFGTK